MFNLNLHIEESRFFITIYFATMSIHSNTLINLHLATAVSLGTSRGRTISSISYSSPLWLPVLQLPLPRWICTARWPTVSHFPSSNRAFPFSSVLPRTQRTNTTTPGMLAVMIPTLHSISDTVQHHAPSPVQSVVIQRGGIARAETYKLDPDCW